MMLASNSKLWVAADGARYFIIPDDARPTEGTELLGDGSGGSMSVDLAALQAYEISEEQAIRWTKANLGSTLTELRASLDETLAGWRANLDAARNEPVAPDTSVA